MEYDIFKDKLKEELIKKITDIRKGVIARVLHPLVEEEETIDLNVLLPLSYLFYFDKQNREDMIKLLSGNLK